MTELGFGDRAGEATELAQLADGNPLFIEQLVAALAGTGESEAALPTTIRELIAARLDALPGSERSVCSTLPWRERCSGAARSSE